MTVTKSYPFILMSGQTANGMPCDVTPYKGMEIAHPTTGQKGILNDAGFVGCSLYVIVEWVVKELGFAYHFTFQRYTGTDVYTLLDGQVVTPR